MSYYHEQDLELKIIQDFNEELYQELLHIDINAHLRPWTYDDIVGCCNSDCVVIGLYLKGKLIGFAALSLVIDEAELYTIGILKAYQGQGLGRKLLHYALKVMQERGAKKCFLEVAVSNHIAQKLYASFNFATVGLRRNYYSQTSTAKAEDALVQMAEL